MRSNGRFGRAITLKKKQTIDELFRDGVYRSGKNLDVIYQVVDQAAKAHVLFTASRRIRTHVDRNCLKRLLREAYRQTAKAEQSRVLLGLIGKDSLLRISFADLKDEMQVILSRLATP